MKGSSQIRTWRQVDGVPAGLCWDFEVFGKIIDKERFFRLCTSRPKGFTVNIGMRLAGSDFVGIDALMEKRKKIKV